MKKWISVHGRTVRYGHAVMWLCGYAIISIASIPAISAIPAITPLTVKPHTINYFIIK